MGLFDLRRCTIDVVADLCARFHGYGSAGGQATYAFAVYENEIPIAAYAWQPPPPGAAISVCPEAPGGVLSLSRMVAVPKTERVLAHISKPLRRQMRRDIDRTRWPVLLTYSDEGQGHTGHVYKCSGWEKTVRNIRPIYVDTNGARASSYSNGESGMRRLTKSGETIIQRWEHWICAKGEAANHMETTGWRRVPVAGKFWRSGAQAMTWVCDPTQEGK